MRDMNNKSAIKLKNNIQPSKKKKKMKKKSAGFIRRGRRKPLEDFSGVFTSPLKGSKKKKVFGHFMDVFLMGWDVPNRRLPKDGDDLHLDQRAAALSGGSCRVVQPGPVRPHWPDRFQRDYQIHHRLAPLQHPRPSPPSLFITLSLSRHFQLLAKFA